MKKSKFEITDKEPMTIWLRSYDEKNFEEPHLLRADKIELINNHLMFYLGKILIFKVYLKDGKWQEYKDIQEALRDVNIDLNNEI